MFGRLVVPQCVIQRVFFMARSRTKGSKHLILAKLLALLVLLLPLRTASTYTDFIAAGFTSSAMTWVDSEGVFLYSASNIFTLSFYSSPGEVSFYLCVIHVASQQVVWTANRNSPIGQSDKLVFSVDGDVSLKRSNGASIVWSTNSSGRGVKRMQMQDSGNLVLLDAANRTLWESFDYPTDTLVPGQALRSGMKLVSSVSVGALASGPYFLSFDSGDLRLVYDLDPPEPYWSLTQDSRLIKLAAGAPSYAVLNVTGLGLIESNGVVVSQLHWSGNSFCRATIGPDGNFGVYVYSSGVWTSQLVALNGCALPLFCGSYGVCSSDQCRCPGTLQPVNENNITAGCQAPSSPPCMNYSSPAFIQYDMVGAGLEYFANQFTLPLKTTSLDHCQTLCTQNCSCSSLFYYNESGNCYLFSMLATIQSTTNSRHVLYVKTTGVPSRAATPPASTQRPPQFLVPVIAGSSGFIIIVMICVFLFWFFEVRKKARSGEENADDDIFLDNIPGLPARFSYKELIGATNNFSTKLGMGGFGSVYEGVLPDKTKVAVKKLESVGQGKKEFRAEVAIIGGIHHVHLVQLRGFCAEGVHRLLVYEFMSNSSLDKCLFIEGEERTVLDWNTRYNIALGTARGLAYLHDDCREKIIHCDIKPENILLDENYNAKVSDFGLAKLMNKEQSQVFTTLRGTRGYLAPEWLMNLAISEKSDVYSFGMVLLEIISGRKNFDPTESSEKWYFPAYAFQQAEHGKLEQLVDAKLRGFVRDEQVTQTVKIALWCIQEDTPARPSMGKVVQMLEGNVQVLPPPLSSQFAVRLHARMVEAMKTSEKSSSVSDYNSRDLLSAVQLSAPR